MLDIIFICQQLKIMFWHNYEILFEKKVEYDINFKKLYYVDDQKLF